MAKPVVVSAARTIDAAPERTYDVTMNTPLDKLLTKRSGAFPAVRSTDEPDGWGRLGAARTVTTSDGNTTREELVRVEPGRAFGYRLSDIKGPMKLLVRGVEGLFTFDAAGSGSRVTWQWTLHPRSALMAPVFVLLRRMWQGWAAHLLDNVEQRSRAS